MYRVNFIMFLVVCFISLSSHAGGKNKNLSFYAGLSGAQEVTGSAEGVITEATGTVLVRFDAGLSSVNVYVTLQNINDVVGAHFHCAPAGANGPLAMGLSAPGPLAINGNVIQGNLTNLDVMGEGCADVIGQPINNIASLAAAMKAGMIYLNIHTAANPGGEIRGQIF